MRALWLVLWLCLAPAWAAAQGVATLVADTVTVRGEAQLVATGNVQAFYQGATLSAAQITYDRASDRLIIEGPIFLRDADGVILTAERGELDPQFENGLLRGARLVLDQQLQLAANQISRVEDGRYSVLTRTVATSCQVCGTRAPLWEIRAANVIHDTTERQLYFEDASLHVRGVPIFWLPRMRLPDPTLDRATGFLVPSLRTTDELGLGIKLPYFIRLGDSRDLTLTPYLGTRTRTLEARYRQAFLSGDIEINAAISRDDLLPDTWRSYFQADGRFDVGRDFRLTFNAQAVSDADYLLAYGISDQDRLPSSLRLERVGAFDLFQAEGTYFASLRGDEVDSSLPPVVLNFSVEKRVVPPLFGGVLTLGYSGDALNRTRDGQPDTARDVARIGASGRWYRDWIGPGGLLLSAETDLQLDYYALADDPAFDSGFRVGPAAAVTLRWPLVRHGAGGTAQVIEPVVSFGWSDSVGITAPNEDGTLAELDEGNLFALTRTPGNDAREVGTRLNVGLSWTGVGRGGHEANLLIGRIYQSQAQLAYSPASGQSTATSDWLLAAGFDTPAGFGMTLRTLLDDELTFNKTETRLDWANDFVDIAAAYVWLPQDPSRDRDAAASEWRLDSAVQVTPSWQLRTDARYDVGLDYLAQAGVGAQWRNECVTVDLSVDRRYTSFTDTDPVTSFEFSVNLTGFSTGRSDAGPTGQCRP